MTPGELRLSVLMRLPVLDAQGVRMRVLDVRTSHPRPPDPPRLVGLLCSPRPVIASLGLKRHDEAASPGRRRTAALGRFVPWNEISSIDAKAIRLRCRFADLRSLADAPDPAPPTGPPPQA